MQPKPVSVRVRLIVLAAAAGAVLAGCGGGSETSAPEAPPHPAGREAAPACVAGDERPLGDERVALMGLARRPLTAVSGPEGRAVASFGLRNENGHPTVLGVLGEVVDARCRPTWYRVQLPIKPNGATGYVRAGDLALHSVETRLVVDLSERRVTLFRRGEPVLRTSAAVGAPGTPTPTGRFFVDQRIVAADPTGPWGPGAIGISAFSPVLADWAQEGPIAIHGTDAPDSIGRAASNGCVRVRNAVLEELFAATQAGSPVLIRA